MKIYIIICIILVAATVTTAQQLSYSIDFINNTDPKITELVGRSDSANFKRKVGHVQGQLFSDGYLLANVDELRFDSVLHATINVGKKYYWQSLGVDNIPEEMLSKVGYQKRDFAGRKFSVPAFSRLMNKLLRYSANNGHPFAEYSMQEVEINQGFVQGMLHYRPGPKIFFDSLTLTPPNLVKHQFLESYLNIKNETLYSHEAILNIALKLDQLAYCDFRDSLALQYQNNLCNVAFELKPRKANKIDALIGFLPNQNTNNSLRLTGFVNLHLENLFRSGKSLSLVWQQFQNASQKLKFDYRHPNIFYSQVGLALDFDLLKQDTSFLNTDLYLGGFFQAKRLEISLSTNLKTSRALSSPNDSLALPDVVDFNLQQFGARMAYSGIGNQVNPIRGSKYYIDFAIGNKSIRQDSRVSDIVYDSISLSSVQIKTEIGGELNHRITGPLIFHMDVRLATVYNNSVLFTNDLLRLGGVNSLRGFNDLEMFVSSYALGRVEARLAFNQNSRLFAFFDQALTKNSTSAFEDTPFGFGAGIFLNTGGGDLQLIYALGVSAEQSLSLTQSKIHIGYVARF